MFAIIFMLGTKYACNDDNNGHLICLQSKIRNELYMLAISFSIDQINLQSSKFYFREIRLEIIVT